MSSIESTEISIDFAADLRICLIDDWKAGQSSIFIV